MSLKVMLDSNTIDRNIKRKNNDDDGDDNDKEENDGSVGRGFQNKIEFQR